jgi:ribA/ribD-fused uncharacterized protein
MILFNSYTKEWAWLSNFSPHPVGPWPTAEHAYQASRTTSPAERELLKHIEHPGYAKKVAKSFTTRPKWESIKVGVMKRALQRKFEDPALMQMLLATGTEELVHLSPWDSFWGVNTKGEGRTS